MMKMTLKYLTLLTMLFSLVACQENKTSATLEVAKSFVINSSGFGGGLIISGHNLSTGQRFSRALTAGVSFSTELPNGNWKFYAMGWPNAYMSGTPKCGHTQAELNGVPTKVGLSVTDGGCSDPVFSYGTTFSIRSCGAFYSWTGSAYARVPEDTTSPTFCNSLSDDLQGRNYLSTRIVAVNSTLGSADGADVFSACNPNTGPMNLPRTNVPLVLELYDAASCGGKVINRFYFPAGIANGSGAFDSFFMTNSGDYFVLPNNKLRRGYSPFMDILPKIACLSGECLEQPNPGAVGRYLNSGLNSRVFISETSLNAPTCTIASVTGGVFTSSSCYVENNIVYADINSTCGSATCSGTITVALNAVNQAPVNLWGTTTGALQIAHRIFNAVWESVGIRTAGTNTQDFFSHFHEKDNDGPRDYFGQLSEVREMLGPDGAGGVLASFGESCNDLLSAAPVSKTITINEDGQQKTFRVDLNASSVAFPGTICSSGIVSNCSSMAYENSDATILIYRLMNGTQKLIYRSHIVCDAKVGAQESIDEENLSSGVYRGTRIFWNTESASSSRFEQYYLEYQANNKYQAGIERFEMTSTTHFKLRKVHFDSKKSANWSQSHLVEELVRENASGEKLSRLSTYETNSNAQMDWLTQNGTFYNDIHFSGSTPVTSECFGVGNTTGQLQDTSFSSISGITGCSTYPSRSTDVHSLSGVQLKPNSLIFSTFKGYFPLLGL